MPSNLPKHWKPATAKVAGFYTAPKTKSMNTLLRDSLYMALVILIALVLIRILFAIGVFLGIALVVIYVYYRFFRSPYRRHR